MKRIIEPSELIITPRGSIYHLDVTPEEIAPTVITVGDPDRVAKVSKYFDTVEHKCAHREFVTHTGRIGNKRISVIGTGIGPDNIDIVMNELDALFNIDFESRTIKEELQKLTIIRMGTCGSLKKEIPVDSMVIGTHGLGFDNLMHFYDYAIDSESQDILESFLTISDMEDAAVSPYIIPASAELLDHFGAEYVKGITATCPGFYGPQGRILRLPLRLPNMIDALIHFKHKEHFVANFEMETSAIYGLGHLLGHRCMSINTVVANRVNRTFSTAADKAIENMIGKSLEIIERI